MNDIHFLATVWDQSISINLIGGSGACIRCVVALTDWLGILSERTMNEKNNYSAGDQFA